jgi:very-short-patch-repair endonuclease
MKHLSQYQVVLTYARRMRSNPTPAERSFWEKVRQKQLLGKKFIRQYIIQHAEVLGRKSYFIADFYCHEKKLIVEIDGPIHLKKEQIAYDQIRESILYEMGYKVIRFTNEEVLNKWDWVERRLRGVL